MSETPRPRPNPRPAQVKPAVAAAPQTTSQKAVVKPAATTASAGSFAIGAALSSTSRYVRKKKPVWRSPAAWIVVVMLGATAGGAWWYLSQRSLLLVSPGEQRAFEAASFSVALQVRAKGLQAGDYQFEMLKGPPGARVDAQTGVFSWTPTELQGPGRYDVQVRAAAKSSSPLTTDAAFVVVVDEDNTPPQLTPPIDATLNLDETRALTLALQATDADVPAQKVSYLLIDGGQYGGAVDAATGQFTFDGKSAKPGQTLSFTAAARDADGATSKPMIFRIQTTGSPPPYDKFIEQATAAALNVQLLGTDPTMLFAAPGKMHSVAGQQRLISYEFATPEEAEQAATLVSPNAADVAGKQIPYAREAEVYVSGRLIFVYLGTEAPVTKLKNLLGRRIADRTDDAAPVMVATTSAPAVVEPTKTIASEYEPIFTLLKQKKLFNLKDYATVRKFYADRFAAEHADLIKQAFGDDEALQAWLTKNANVKEELFLAIDPKNDDVAAVLTLFKEQHRLFPTKLLPYSELAIAVSVTWDKERNIYDYTGHQKRVHATMPELLLGAVENFKYYVEAEQVMQGRIQYVPWEFLIHAVNSRTPLDERMWALQNYLNKRVMFGECYSQVPYDNEMLRTDDLVCRMADKPYTLPNLVQFGGVCAQQADFAARVGKTLGVPAEYVTGEGNLGGLHAWVMWVELKQVTASGIGFSLESYGRYNSDFYYVGHLRDPQTGQRITDRQLELRLQTVGMNVPAKRHAERIMEAYPIISAELKYTVKDRLEFLSELLKLCVGNEAGWHALAAISKSEEVGKTEEKLLVAALDNLFRTFVKVPDFTLEVFDDLIGFRKEVKDKIALYQRLVQLYDGAQRPDLACEAAATLADKMAGENQTLEACQGLMTTIYRYPTEGRYVPKLVDQIERLAQGIPGADTQMAQFYQKFLPVIPRARGDEPSTYCIKMFEKGIAKFRAVGQEAAAQAAEAELVKIKTPK